MANQGLLNACSFLVLYCALVSILTVRPSISVCYFPDFLQTNISDRAWMGRIKDQNTEVTLQISISDTTMHVTTTDSTATSYSRACVKSLDDKYLVAHEEQGQTGALFSCMQFILRSDNVLQIREAPVGTSMNRKICNANQLELNPWLIIDTNHVSDDTRVLPLQGGYSMSIFDKRSDRAVCDGYQGQPRMESECVRGEGLVFHFRYRHCVPHDLYMYMTQRTLCLAHWEEGPYTFALLRHDESPQYMWLLRFQSSMGDNDYMVLFSDLVADMDRRVKETNRFLRLNVVRDTERPAHALCVDDYEVCTQRNNPCDDEAMAMLCPRTCGICHETRPRTCIFAGKHQGQWYNAAEPTTLALTVNTTHLTTYSGNIQEQLQCIEWDPEPSVSPHSKPYASSRMLVHEFYNGCRPRYSCAQFTQKSNSVLFFKLSQGLSWPFTSTPREPIDCSQFSYEDHESLTPNQFRSRNLNLVYFRASNSVPCDLPRTEGEYVVSLKDGNECTASIVQNLTANSFSIDLVNCSTETDVDITYTCAESARMFPRKDLVVVTRSSTDPDAIFCWLLPRHVHDVFYLFPAVDCNEAMPKRLSRGRLKPLATITRTGQLPDLDYEMDLPNELPEIVTTPPLKHPRPTQPEDSLKPPRYTPDDNRVLPDMSHDLNMSYPRGNATADHESNMRITAASVVVVTVVVLVAVVQSICVCS